MESELKQCRLNGETVLQLVLHQDRLAVRIEDEDRFFATLSKPTRPGMLPAILKTP